MTFARLIARITYQQDHWQAYDIAETRLENNRTIARQIQSMPWDVNVSPAVITISGSEPDEMTLKQLNRLIREKQ